MAALMKVKVDGTDTPILTNSLSADNSVGQRSTASVTLQDADGSNHYDEGQQIVIEDADGNRVFGGFIDDDDEQMADDADQTGMLYHKLTLKDNHYLADKRLVATSYESGDTCGDIFADVLTNTLADEGVTSKANWLTANQSDVETNTAGLDSWGSGTTTITRDTTEHWHGAASLKVVTDGTHSFQGAAVIVTAATYQVGVPYTASVYLMGSGTVGLQLQTDDTFAVIGDSLTITLTGAWTRYSVTGIIPAGLTGDLDIVVDTTAAVAQTWYMDGMQLEIGTAARPWALGGSSFIADGPTLPDVVFNYCTAAAAFDAITQKAGNYWWQIDEYRQLWFQAYAAIVAPWSLTADGNNVVTDARRGTVKVKRGKPKYRNRQYMRGATGTTDQQTESRVGDGTTTAFTMSYPLAKVPTITKNGSAQTVGIKGLDTGKDWYWSAGDPVIAQDTSGTVLAGEPSPDTLQVVYFGQFPLLIISEDTAEIIAQQTLEGGGTTGKVEDITEDTSLTTSAAAFAEAAALLAKYGQKAKTLTFQTKRSGLVQGQLLTVTIPQHGFSSETFLISSVHISDQDGKVIWYDVTAIQGPVDTTWEKFFGVLVNSAQAGTDVLSVGSSTALVILSDFDATASPSATFTTTVNACSFPGSSLYPGTSLYPC